MQKPKDHIPEMNGHSKNPSSLTTKISNASPQKRQIPPPLIICLLCLAVIFYFAFTLSYDISTTQTNFLIGSIAAGFMFIVFSLVYLPFEEYYTRFVASIAILYLLSMTVLLFQKVDDVRQFLTFFDPKLGKPLPERSYAEHCELYTPNDPTSSFRNLMDTVYDEFILAHLFGWTAKMIMYRDSITCIFLSLLFEILEQTFKHHLPNFAECWWDQIILDILVCNTVGMITGAWILNKFFVLKSYDWTGLGRSWETSKRREQVLKSPHTQEEIDQVTQEYEIAKSKDFIHSWKRFVAVFCLVTATVVNELNAFYLKYILWVPPPHPLNIGRLFFWVGFGVPSLKEYHSFVCGSKKEMGPLTYLVLASVLVETIVCVKLGRGLFTKPAPEWVFWPWVIGTGIVVLWAIVNFGWVQKKSGQKKQKSG